MAGSITWRSAVCDPINYPKMILRSKLLRDLVLPLGDLAFGQRMISRLKFLEKAQYWSSDRILLRQSEDLQRLINIAYSEVKFYKGLLNGAGVKPEQIKNRSDLTKLPLVTKEMLRAAYPNQVTRLTGQKTYEASTSGSSGQNFFVREDAYTAGWYRATFLLELQWSGWTMGAPHLQTGMTLLRSLDRRLKDWLLGCHYVSAYDLTDNHLKAILEEMEKYHLRYLWGYPGSLYYLARYAQKAGWNQPLISAVTWGDMLFPHYRQEIESAFQTKVFDTYGCAEGFHIAGQCGTGSHYHSHDLDVIVEYLDDNEQPVPYGQAGHVVITRLHPGPMPLIRYKVGDIAVPQEGLCSCGRGFSLMSAIQGRDTDIILTPAGNRLIVHFFTGILEHFPQINTFQIVQEEIDSILLRIVPYGDLDSTIQSQIILALQAKGIDALQVTIELVDNIPLTSGGKRRFIMSHLSSAQQY